MTLFYEQLWTIIQRFLSRFIVRQLLGKESDRFMATAVYQYNYQRGLFNYKLEDTQWCRKLFYYGGGGGHQNYTCPIQAH